jgi:hypothetical protein
MVELRLKTIKEASATMLRHGAGASLLFCLAFEGFLYFLDWKCPLLEISLTGIFPVWYIQKQDGKEVIDSSG